MVKVETRERERYIVVAAVYQKILPPRIEQIGLRGCTGELRF